MLDGVYSEGTRNVNPVNKSKTPIWILNSNKSQEKIHVTISFHDFPYMPAHTSVLP